MSCIHRSHRQGLASTFRLRPLMTHKVNWHTLMVLVINISVRPNMMSFSNGVLQEALDAWSISIGRAAPWVWHLTRIGRGPCCEH